MSIKDRGFASMDRERQRAIAQQGGRVAHQRGLAHQWTPAEAAAAGRKGAQSRHKRGSRKKESAELNAQRTPAVIPFAAPAAVERCWTLQGADGRTLQCETCAVEGGFEVRVGYADQPLMLSGVLATMAESRQVAESWRLAVLAKGNFTEPARPETLLPTGSERMSAAG